MSLRILTLSFILLAAASTSCLAQDTNGDGLTTFLVPISTPDALPGAYGTLWQTSLWLHNGSSQSLRLRDCGNVIGPPCDRPIYEPGTTRQVSALERFSAAGPVLFYVPADIAGDILLSNRLFELTRNSQPAGVHIPIVREDRFFRSATRFIGIPNAPDSRVTLRVYDPRRKVGSTVRVEIFDTDDRRLASRDVSLNYASSPADPGTAVVNDLTSVFPNLPPVFDIRVSAVTPGMEYWAMVSLTDNRTQQALLVLADE